MKSYIAAVGLAGLVSSVAGHGYIVSPPPRMPGDAQQAACGQQIYNQQSSDHFGNVQGSLQVSQNQDDYNEADCNIWLCKGTKFEDNKDNVQSYTAGQTVPMEINIRAPHTGSCNVSIVDTATGSVIGEPLKSFDTYASNSAPIGDDQTNFDITIPEDLGNQCSEAGACVIQWFWDADQPDIDQTYEACIDFTVGGSGSGSGSGNTTTPEPETSAPAASPTTPAATPSATAVEAETPSASAGAGSGSGSDGDVPETFTLDTFVAWLQEQSGSSSSTKRDILKMIQKAAVHPRRHARAFA